MDLSKLPWEVRRDPEHGMPYVAAVGVSGPILLAEDDGPAGLKALQDAAMAHNAFDVMMRRGWFVECDSEKWFVRGEASGPLSMMGDCVWADPFTALVEADQWYTKNVEGK